MPTWDVNMFFTRINPWKFVEKDKNKIDKVIQRLLKPNTLLEYSLSTNIE